MGQSGDRWGEMGPLICMRHKYKQILLILLDFLRVLLNWFGFCPQYMYLNVFEIAYKLNKILTPPPY